MVYVFRVFLWKMFRKLYLQLSPIVVWGSPVWPLVSTASCLVSSVDSGTCASIGELAPSGSPSSRAAESRNGPVSWAVFGSAGNWACPEVCAGKGQPVHRNGNSSRSAICLRLTANLPFHGEGWVFCTPPVAVVSLWMVWPSRHKSLEHLSWAHNPHPSFPSLLLPHPLT